MDFARVEPIVRAVLYEGVGTTGRGPHTGA
jgi:hypothetical protein